MSCRDVSDAMLVLELMCAHWIGLGLKNYIESKDYCTGVSHIFAAAIRTRFEVANTESSSPILSSRDAGFDTLVRDFIWGMWRSLDGGSDSLLEKEDAFAVWMEVYRVYCASRSVIGARLTPIAFEKHEEDWTMRCRSELPRSEDTKLCAALMQLEENIHNVAFRQCFPPGERV